MIRFFCLIKMNYKIHIGYSEKKTDTTLVAKFYFYYIIIVIITIHGH